MATPRRTLGPLAVVMLLSSVALPLIAAERPPASADEFFEPTKLWTIDLRISAERWKIMQPTRRSALAEVFGVRTAATRPATRPDDPFWEEGRRLDPSPFGYQYAYVRAAFELGGTTWRDVALRFKGNSSYMSAGKGQKRPFKVDFNRFLDDLEFAGLTKLNLNNNAFDPSQMREAVSYEFFRAVGVPAPRTTYALVYLTIEGQSDRQCLGLYTVIEEVNKDFLKSRFDTRKGLLLKPELRGDLPHYGSHWQAYEDKYFPKTDPTPETSRRIIELTELVHKADDAEFRRKIGDYVEIDAFLRFIAANALLANLDSFLTTAHNYYLFVHPQTLRAHFVPWDLNLSFGAFSWVGSPQEQADLSIDRPHTSPNRLTERLMAIPEVSQRYRQIVREMLRQEFTAETMHARIDAHQAVIDEAGRRMREAGQLPATFPGRGMSRDTPQLKPFVTARIASVRSQLEGKSSGYQPRWQAARIFGFRNRRAGGPATRPEQ